MLGKVHVCKTCLTRVQFSFWPHDKIVAQIFGGMKNTSHLCISIRETTQQMFNIREIGIMVGAAEKSGSGLSICVS